MPPSPAPTAALLQVIERLCGFQPRRACSDAERRATVWLHDELRAAGTAAWVETHWVRPQWAESAALHCGLGAAASLASTEWPAVAVAVLVLTALSLGLEATGRTGLLRLAFYRRATQTLVTDPPDPDAVTLLIAANVDAPHQGLVLRHGWRRAGARLRVAGLRTPGVLAWLALALAAVAAAAAARVAGAEGTVLGGVQLVPTIALVLACAAAIDIALSPFAPGAGDNASGVAVALALHAALGRRRLRRLSPALMLSGAGDAQPLGARAQLRRDRRDASRVVVLEVGPCGAGRPAWWSRHAQLAAVAERAAAERGALRERGRAPSAARAAAGRRLAAIAVRCVDPDGVPPLSRMAADVPSAVEPAALEASLAFCLALVEELDLDLEAADARRAP